MPYGISENQSDCSNWAAVKIESDGSATTLACYETKQDAIDRMVAQSLAEGMEPVGEVGQRNISQRNDELVGFIDAAIAVLSQGKAYYQAEESEPEEEIEPEEEMEDSEQRAVNLEPPMFMRDNAKRGLQLHEEGFSGDGLVPQTVEDARKMVEGIVTEAKWRKIGAWIARHMDDLDAIEGDEITAGLVAMLLWGGGSTKTEAKRTMDYAYSVVEKLDSEMVETDSARDYDWKTMTDTIHWVTTPIDDKRSIVYSNLEVRAENEGRTIVGYAAVWDSPSEYMGFTEFVKRGAFTKTLNDGADVRLLIDHEGVPLARSKSGTLKLSEDERGLRVEAELDPANPDAARIMSAMKRGDLSQMSFAFRTVKDSWNADRSVRELREVQLFDVSVVTFPAYEETMAELRKANEPVTVVPVSTLSLRKNQVALQKLRSR
jgi:HK97 family phage prohead protease